MPVSGGKGESICVAKKTDEALSTLNMWAMAKIARRQQIAGNALLDSTRYVQISHQFSTECVCFEENYVSSDFTPGL